VRTVFAKILLWSLGTLVLALAAYFFISGDLARRISGKGGPFERTVAFQVDEAEETYRSRGPEALGRYLQRLQAYFGPEHFFTDARGNDLVTGEDRSALLAAGRGGGPRSVGDRFVAVAASKDGAYRLIATGRPPFTRWSFLPYYGLMLLVVALLCWMLAINIASPLRELAHVVERFGRGDLSVRVKSSRRDEIGDLARAFDQMAERIGTLLTAERRLLQDISHELRSPLARLSFAAELTRTAPDREAAVARMKKEIERLTSLVGALVEVTRAEGDPASRRLEDVDLSALAGELVDALRVEADARGSKLHFDGTAPATIRGDRELLRRALENVLGNAIRYAPPGTTIEVRQQTTNGNAALSVRDYGPGVPEEILAKIFLPFFRADGSRDSQTGGVGLGLAIAQRAIAAHHGRIAAANAQPGLRVTLELPIQG
jgi:signal transduction histidine kinase